MLRSDLGPHIAGAWWARGVGTRLEDRGDGPDGRVVFQPTPRHCTGRGGVLFTVTVAHGHRRHCCFSSI